MARVKVVAAMVAQKVRAVVVAAVEAEKGEVLHSEICCCLLMTTARCLRYLRAFECLEQQRRHGSRRRKQV
jgi:hypothetical protein